MGGDKPSENLANLLESHDIAKVRTGLSMIDTMEEIPLEQILWLQLMHNESEIRKTAKSILGKKDFQNEGTQTQIDAINLIVKENWKANYRTTKGKIGTNLCNLENKLNSIDFTIFDILIKELNNLELCRYISEALGLLKDERAVKPLIQVLESGPKNHPQILDEIIPLFRKDFQIKVDPRITGAAARALGEIGTKEATGTLIKKLYDHKQYDPLDVHIGEALGKNSDFRFFEQCLEEIVVDELSRKKNISKKLLFDTLDSTNFSKLKPDEINEKLDGLIILLNYEDPQTSGTYQVESSSGGNYSVTEHSCTCMGYEFRRSCRHIDMVRDGTSKIKYRIIKRTKTALKKIVEANVDEKENILKFLDNDDSAMIMMGASMLKGILESNN